MHTLDLKHSQNFEFLNLHNIAYNWNQNETLAYKQEISEQLWIRFEGSRI